LGSWPGEVTRRVQHILSLPVHRGEKLPCFLLLAVLVFRALPSVHLCMLVLRNEVLYRHNIQQGSHLHAANDITNFQGPRRTARACNRAAPRWDACRITHLFTNGHPFFCSYFRPTGSRSCIFTVLCPSRRLFFHGILCLLFLVFFLFRHLVVFPPHVEPVRPICVMAHYVVLQVFDGVNRCLRFVLEIRGPWGVGAECLRSGFLCQERGVLRAVEKVVQS